jgi:myo-inositol-1(or 4)-monophosphatase
MTVDADQRADDARPRSDAPLSLRLLAESLARSAGGIALAGRRAMDEHRSYRSETKASATDVVTEYDEAAERHIVATLRALRPDDGIVGEEGTDHRGASGFDWYIDPIDGTTNFVYDQPAWACSVAVGRGDDMIAGAVYWPRLDEMFSAAAGAGATRNDQPIHVSDRAELPLALVGTGFGYQRERRRAQAARLAALIGEVRDVRRLGSAAIDLCLVACGRLDAYYERHLNAWDVAAGELIAREAGAIATDFSGGPSRPEELLVATPGIHADLLRLLD